jgi:hypothetical protein
LGLDAERALRHLGGFRENPKVRYDKPETHQCDASANPCEKSSLCGEIVPQISH